MSQSIQDLLPKSRLTLTYKTEVDGRLAPVELPFRMLVLGDFSGRSDPDGPFDKEDQGARTVESDIDERRIRNVNPDNMKAGKEPHQGPMYQLIEKMGGPLKDQPPGRTGIQVTLDVENKLTGNDTFRVDLPITSLRSFDPDQIIEHVPRLRCLLLIRKLLMEVQANLSNRKEFRKIVDELYKDPATLQTIMTELDKLQTDAQAAGVPLDFAALKIPPLDTKFDPKQN
jgi:type VI secretion system protein ImpB